MVLWSRNTNRGIEVTIRGIACAGNNCQWRWDEKLIAIIHSHAPKTLNP